MRPIYALLLTEGQDGDVFEVWVLESDVKRCGMLPIMREEDERRIERSAQSSIKKTPPSIERQHLHIVDNKWTLSHYETPIED